MLLIFDQKACAFRRKDYAVWNILVLFVAVHHLVRLAAMNVYAFHFKPAFLLGRKWGYQQDLFACPSTKRIAKCWINHRQEKKVVRASGFPFSEHFQNVV